MMLKHKPLDGAQIMGLDAAVACEPHLAEPEFAFTFGVADVDVRRFIALVRVKMETKGTDAQNCRQD